MSGKTTVRGRRLVTTRGRLNAPRNGGLLVKPYVAGSDHSVRTQATARVQIPVNSVIRAGTSNVTPVTGDPWNNHYFANDGLTWVEVKNNGTVTATVSFEPNPALPTDGLGAYPWVVPVRAGDTVKVGPFVVSTFTRDTANDIYVDVQSASLTLAAYKIASTFN